eukprot:m.349163 g.349163  ORF g.349163 m.349163 type:complete len:83 (+) comp40556_c0_seq1:238-486(+)
MAVMMTSCALDSVKRTSTLSSSAHFVSTDKFSPSKPQTFVSMAEATSQRYDMINTIAKVVTRSCSIILLYLLQLYNEYYLLL